jgi:hypothetical protein
MSAKIIQLRKQQPPINPKQDLTEIYIMTFLLTSFFWFGCLFILGNLLRMRGV